VWCSVRRHAWRPRRLSAGRGTLEQAPPRVCNRAAADTRQWGTRVHLYRCTRSWVIQACSADLWAPRGGKAPFRGSGVPSRAASAAICTVARHLASITGRSSGCLPLAIAGPADHTILRTISER
jgi:hypothetical protein